LIDGFLSEFEAIYQKSGVARSFDEYLQLGKLVLFIGFIVEYFLLMGLHYLLGVQGVNLFTGPLILSVILTLVTFVVLAWYPIYIRDIAVNEIDKNLLYTVTFMLMLSKGGLAIEKIIERVSETEQSKYLRNFFNKFLINISVFGFNPQESLRDVKNRSPSELFTRFLDSIVNTIQTSGDLSKLFQFESELLIQRKEEENNELLNNLGFLSEIYVTMLVIAPLLLLVLLTTFSFAGQSSGTSGINSLNLVVFAGIPLLSILMMILIDMQVSVD
jgi:flagellar protein FlaJ